MRAITFIRMILGLTGLADGAHADDVLSLILTGQNAATSPAAYITGNTAAATAGLNVSIYGGPASIGAASVLGVTQSVSLSLNNATSLGGNLTFGDTISPFSQSVAAGLGAMAGSNTTIPVAAGPATTNPVTFDNTLNTISALTVNGRSTIAGPASGVLNEMPTQMISQSGNAASVSGFVSGYLVQSAGGQQDAGRLPTTNLTAATVSVGVSTISNISQAQKNSFNIVNAGGASSLQLFQNSFGAAGSNNYVTAGGSNVQIASSGTGATSIAGAEQSLNSGVNIASLNVLQGSSMNQQLTNGSTYNSNLLQSAGGSAFVTGAQRAFGTGNLTK